MFEIADQYEGLYDTIGDYDFKVYDNGGQTIDQYTMVILGEDFVTDAHKGYQWALHMSGNPLSAQGVCMHSEVYYEDDSHLGEQVSYADLPEQVQEAIQRECASLAKMEAEYDAHMSA